MEAILDSILAENGKDLSSSTCEESLASDLAYLRLLWKEDDM
jgi:hypothetical protein